MSYHVILLLQQTNMELSHFSQKPTFYKGKNKKKEKATKRHNEPKHTEQERKHRWLGRPPTTSNPPRFENISPSLSIIMFL